MPRLVQNAIYFVLEILFYSDVNFYLTCFMVKLMDFVTEEAVFQWWANSVKDRESCG